MFKTVKMVLAATAVVTLVACGGGGDGGNSSPASGLAVFNNLLANVFTGKTYGVGAVVSSSSQTSVNDCTTWSANSSQATAEANAINSGSTIYRSTDAQWCASSSGQYGCLTQVGSSIVLQYGSSTSERVLMYMPSLISNHMTVVQYDYPNSSSVSILSIVPDASISSGSCRPSANQSATAVNGTWTGYSATYNPVAFNGTSSNVTMNCSNQICVISDAPTVSLTLSQLGSTGNWMTNLSSTVYATAALSEDIQLLSMAVCSTPTSGVQNFNNCKFYTFKR